MVVITGRLYILWLFSALQYIPTKCSELVSKTTAILSVQSSRDFYDDATHPNRTLFLLISILFSIPFYHPYILSFSFYVNYSFLCDGYLKTEMLWEPLDYVRRHREGQTVAPIQPRPLLALEALLEDGQNYGSE